MLFCVCQTENTSNTIMDSRAVDFRFADDFLNSFLQQYPLAKALERVADFGHGCHFEYNHLKRIFTGTFLDHMTCDSGLTIKHQLEIRLSVLQSVWPKVTDNNMEPGWVDHVSIKNVTSLKQIQTICRADSFQLKFNGKAQLLDIIFLGSNRHDVLLKITLEPGLPKNGLEKRILRRFL